MVSGDDLESRPAVNLVDDCGMTPHGRWVNAKDLRIGDTFLDYLGNAYTLDGIAIREDSVTVYNFEVAGTHTYTVSNLGVLVHNDGCGLRTWQEAGISQSDALRIQNAANKSQQRIVVVGSRAGNGNLTPLSDWDYIVSGTTSRQRHSIKNSLPRGIAGGELGWRGETGIDFWQDANRNALNYNPLNPNLPHVIFAPQ